MLAAALLAVPAATADNPRHNYGADFTHVAFVKANSVNMRISPDANSSYLAETSLKEEMYFSPDDVNWSHMMGRYDTPKKHQLYEGNTLGVLGFEGDWVNMYYSLPGNPFDVWTLRKFVDLVPTAPITCQMTAPSENGVSYAHLWAPEQGNWFVIYQEPGMDEDGGFFIGHIKNNVAVAERWVQGYVQPDETDAARLELTKVDGMPIVMYGRKHTFTPDEPYGYFNVASLTPEIIARLWMKGKEIPAENRPFAVGLSDGRFHVQL